RNRAPANADGGGEHPTPTTDAKPVSQLQVGVDIFWGYASGVVATRLPDGTEIVLAERTRPFNQSDASYFHPLMEMVERRLGRRPRYGTWDCAYDAHYVYDYFDQAGGFAAVPFNSGKRGNGRLFAPDGVPLCAAELPMTLQFTYKHRADLIEHTREKFRCPLLYPSATAECCPIGDAHWDKGGCTTTIAQGPGSRIRHTLDRQSQSYKELYAKRTMVERINSQAEALDILRPKLRNGKAIANRNTLTYVLINLRALARLRQAAQQRQPASKQLTLTA
ncbi:MAG TPA: transposase, partial [Roseiflexaceae bacterium]|nr:transposase [Roseiflexaceae bacterium]